MPEGTDFDSETTQQGLTDRQRELAQTLTAQDASLPPGMFHDPAEFDALRALIVQRDAVRGVNEDTPGQSAEDRKLDDVIDEQLTANAWERYTGSGDEGEDDEVIDNLDISDGELGDALLRIRTELHAPAVRGQVACRPTNT